MLNPTRVLEYMCIYIIHKRPAENWTLKNAYRNEIIDQLTYRWVTDFVFQNFKSCCNYDVELQGNTNIAQRRIWQRFLWYRIVWLFGCVFPAFPYNVCLS